jgi:hypothetical protein
MKITNYKYLLLPLLVCFIACHQEGIKKVKQVEVATTSFFDDLEIEKYDFIVSSFDDGLVRSKFKLDGTPIFDPAIINHFAYPLLLKKEMNNGSIKPYATFSFKNKIYQVSDLFSLLKSNKELDNISVAQLDSIYKLLLKKGSGNEVVPGLNKDKLTSKQLLTSLAELSVAFNKPEISGFINDTVFPSPNENYFLNKLDRLGGWRVFIFDGQAVLWNYFEEGDNAVLMLNVMNKGVFAAVSYPKEMLTSPFADGDVDLLQSPLADRILRSLYCLKLETIDIENWLTIKKEVLSSRYHFLLARELRSLLGRERFKQADPLKYSELKGAYGQAFTGDIPFDYFFKKPLVKIDYVGDNVLLKREFELEHDAYVRLFVSGQVFDESGTKERAMVRDNIDIIMVSPDNEKIRFWRRFFYHCLHDNGKIDSPVLFPFAYKDISSNSYQLEIQLPWSVINGLDKKKCPLQALFTFNDCDKDPLKSEGSLSHAVDLVDLNYVEQSPRSGFKGLYAVKTNSIPVIDGEEDYMWNDIPHQKMPIVTNGEVESSNDASCSFKAMWDEDNLYLLFAVVDQVKTYPYLLNKDYCRILNQETGELIWQTSGDKSKHFPFFTSDDKFRLNKGKYVLEYISDQYLSFSNWHKYGLPVSFYGAYLYLEPSELDESGERGFDDRFNIILPF